jgi:hypothetical protein
MEDANVKDLTNEQDQENEEHEEVVTTRVQHFGGTTDPFADTDEVGTRNTISSEEYSGEDEVWSTSNSQLTIERPYQTMSFEGWEDAKLHYNKYSKNVGFSIKSNTSRNSDVGNERETKLSICLQLNRQKF